jgi:hypothetical protein
MPLVGSPWYFIGSTVLVVVATVIVFAEGRILRGFGFLIAAIASAGLSVYRYRGGR